MHVFNLYSFPELLKYISWNHHPLSQKFKYKTKSSNYIQRPSDAFQNKEIYSKPFYLCSKSMLSDHAAQYHKHFRAFIRSFSPNI